MTRHDHLSVFSCVPQDVAEKFKGVRMDRVLGFFDAYQTRTLLPVSIAEVLEERHQHPNYTQRTIGLASSMESLESPVVSDALAQLECFARTTDTAIDANDSRHQAGQVVIDDSLDLGRPLFDSIQNLGEVASIPF